MIAPGLGDVFDFHIGGKVKPHLLSLFPYVITEKVIPYYRDISGIEGQVSFFRYLFQVLIAFNRYLAHGRALGNDNLRGDMPYSY